MYVGRNSICHVSGQILSAFVPRFSQRRQGRKNHLHPLQRELQGIAGDGVLVCWDSVSLITGCSEELIIDESFHVGFLKNEEAISIAFGGEDSSNEKLFQRSARAQPCNVWIFLITVLEPLFLDSHLRSSPRIICQMVQR